MDYSRRWYYSISFSAAAVGLVFLFDIGGENPVVKTTLMTSFLILSLYVFEPLPLGQISLIAMFLLLASGVASVDQVLSGFASEAAFIVLLGIFLSNAMAKTSIPSRIVYFVINKIGGTAGGLLVCIIILPVITSIFIPATVIRTTSLIPVVYKVLRWMNVEYNSKAGRKQMMGLAVGSNISSIVFVTAAPANLIAVEIINQSLDVHLGYLGWFLLMFPIWVLMVPISWIVLNFVYGVGEYHESFERAELEAEKRSLGRLSRNDKVFLGVMVSTIGFWVTQPLHGLSLVFPIFLAAVLLSLPRMGIITWQNIKVFNIDLFFFVGATVSLAGILSASGTIDWVTKSVEYSFISVLFESPLLAIVSSAILTQIFHVMITNVNAAVITFLPIVIGVSVTVGADSLVLALSVTASCVLCFLLAIESLASTAVLATGTVSQRDFLKTGAWLTIASIIVVVLVASYWWPPFMKGWNIAS